MKKLLVLILALTVCLALFACGGGEDPTCTEHIDADSNGKCDSCGATVEPEDDGGKTDEDLVLVTDSVTGFAIVCANSLSDKATGYVIDFMNTLNRYYLEDGNLKQNYDAPGFDDAVEVIFGAPKNRGDAFIKDEHYLGYKGFSIELIGNKLFVLGGGDKGYQDAIKYLEQTLFNLEGYETSSIADQIMWIDADTMNDQDFDIIPTGNIISVKGTPYDFTAPKAIGRDFDSDPDMEKQNGGYDNNFIFNNYDGTINKRCTLTAPVNGLEMTVYTDQPCVGVYTSNMMNPEDPAFKGGVKQACRCAVCFETQKMPDAINNPGFTDTVLNPGETYTHTTVFAFAN